MKFFREPVNFEEEEWEHLVIGYFHGKAIVKDENNRLFFLKCEEAVAPIGTTLPKGVAEPIEKLSSTEQEQIEEVYKV